MFVRLNVQYSFGNQFDKLLWKNTADEAATAFSGSEYAVDPARGSVPGDILYWFGTPKNSFGHVGFRMFHNKLGENSTRHRYGPEGCKGLADITVVRKPELIVRLPFGLMTR
jgi:hypothetical protein